MKCIYKIRPHHIKVHIICLKYFGDDSLIINRKEGDDLHI
jgi:hypothetical protein